MDRKMSPLNKRENLKYLRRYMRLTQKDFICQFYTDENGKAAISTATLSNLESKGGARLNDVILAVSESLNMDPMIFSLSPNEFAERIESVLDDVTNAAGTKKNETKNSKVYHLLSRLTVYFAEQILERKLQKGSKIESDRVLAQKMGVGRSAVREALRVLDVLGMIDIRPGQGSYISNDEANFFVIPLSWSLFLNGTQTDSILEVRDLLEIKAAELAAKCGDNEKLMKLDASIHGQRRACETLNFKAFLESDLEFHQAIAECSGNQVIVSLKQTITNLMRHISGSGMVNEQQLRDSFEEHQKIYEFIIKHDSVSAAHAMKEHMERSMQRYNY